MPFFFFRPFAQDVGLFRCVAFNLAGAVSHQARIGVIGPPYAHPIADQTAVIGHPHTLTCPYSGYPVAEVYFAKGKGRRLPYDERHLAGQLGDDLGLFRSGRFGDLVGFAPFVGFGDGVDFAARIQRRGTVTAAARAGQ